MPLLLSIRARDTGVSMFIAKPVSAKALRERSVWVLNHPLPFIWKFDYFGLDRWRKDISLPKGERKRCADAVDMMSKTG